MVLSVSGANLTHSSNTLWLISARKQNKQEKPSQQQHSREHRLHCAHHQKGLGALQVSGLARRARFPRRAPVFVPVVFAGDTHLAVSGAGTRLCHSTRRWAKKACEVAS